MVNTLEVPSGVLNNKSVCIYGQSLIHWKPDIKLQFVREHDLKGDLILLIGFRNNQFYIRIKFVSGDFINSFQCRVNFCRTKLWTIYPICTVLHPRKKRY